MKVRITDLLDDYSDSSVKLKKPSYSAKAVKTQVLTEISRKAPVRQPSRIVLAAACLVLAVSLGTAIWFFAGPRHSQGVTLASEVESNAPEPAASSPEPSPMPTEVQEEKTYPGFSADVVKTMWTAANFDLDNAVLKTESEHGYTMAVPKEYEGELRCNTDGAMAFQMDDNFTLEEWGQGGFVFGIRVLDTETFYGMYDVAKGQWATWLHAQEYMLGRSEDQVILLVQPNDVQYDASSQESMDSYYRHVTAAYVMILDFLWRNGIEENPKWGADCFSNVIQRLEEVQKELEGMYETQRSWTLSDQRINTDMLFYWDEMGDITLIAQIANFAGGAYNYHLIPLTSKENAAPTVTASPTPTPG